MTVAQYDLLVQYAADLRSALYSYEEKYGVIDLKDDRIAEIVAAAANLINLVDSFEPIRSPKNHDPF